MHIKKNQHLRYLDCRPNDHNQAWDNHDTLNPNLRQKNDSRHNFFQLIGKKTHLVKRIHVKIITEHKCREINCQNYRIKKRIKVKNFVLKNWVSKSFQFSSQHFLYTAKKRNQNYNAWIGWRTLISGAQSLNSLI